MADSILAPGEIVVGKGAKHPINVINKQQIPLNSPHFLVEQVVLYIFTENSTFIAA